MSILYKSEKHNPIGIQLSYRRANTPSPKLDLFTLSIRVNYLFLVPVLRTIFHVYMND